MNKSRGFGLLELIASCLLLLLLLGLQVVLFQSSSASFQKVSTQSDLVQQLEIVLLRLSRDIQGSTVEGLSLNSQGLCLVSALQGDSPVEYGPLGNLVWKQYRLYYLEAASDEIRVAERPLPVASDLARPIEQVDFGPGPRPLATYFVGGRALARWVQHFEITLMNKNLTVTCRAARTRYGSQVPEEVELRQTTCLRN